MLNNNFNSPLIGGLQGMQQQRRPQPQQQGGDFLSNVLGMQRNVDPSTWGQLWNSQLAPQPGTNMQHGGGLQMGQPPATRATPSTDAASSGMGSPIENSPMIQAFLQMMAMRGMGPQQPRRF